MKVNVITEIGCSGSRGALGRVRRRVEPYATRADGVPGARTRSLRPLPTRCDATSEVVWLRSDRGIAFSRSTSSGTNAVASGRIGTTGGRGMAVDQISKSMVTPQS